MTKGKATEAPSWDDILDSDRSPQIKKEGETYSPSNPTWNEEMGFIPDWQATFDDDDILWITAPNPRNPDWIVKYRMILEEGREPIVSEMRIEPAIEPFQDPKGGMRPYLRGADVRVPIFWANRLARLLWWVSGRQDLYET